MAFTNPLYPNFLSFLVSKTIGTVGGDPIKKSANSANPQTSKVDSFHPSAKGNSPTKKQVSQEVLRIQKSENLLAFPNIKELIDEQIKQAKEELEKSIASKKEYYQKFKSSRTQDEINKEIENLKTPVNNTIKKLEVLAKELHGKTPQEIQNRLLNLIEGEETKRHELNIQLHNNKAPISQEEREALSIEQQTLSIFIDKLRRLSTSYKEKMPNEELLNNRATYNLTENKEYLLAEYLPIFQSLMNDPKRSDELNKYMDLVRYLMKSKKVNIVLTPEKHDYNKEDTTYKTSIVADKSTRFMVAARIAELYFNNPDLIKSLVNQDKGLEIILAKNIFNVPKYETAAGEYYSKQNKIVMDFDYLWIKPGENAQHAVLPHEVAHGLDAIPDNVNMLSVNERKCDGILKNMSKKQRSEFVNIRDKLFQIYESHKKATKSKESEKANTKIQKGTDPATGLPNYAFENNNEFIADTISEFYGNPKSFFTDGLNKDAKALKMKLYNLYKEVLKVDPLELTKSKPPPKDLRDLNTLSTDEILDEMRKIVNNEGQKKDLNIDYESLLKPSPKNTQKVLDALDESSNNGSHLLRSRAIYNLTGNPSAFNRFLPIRNHLEKTNQAKAKEYDRLVNEITKRANICFKHEIKSDQSIVAQLSSATKVDESTRYLIAAQIVELLFNRPDLIELILKQPKRLNIVLADNITGKGSEGGHSKLDENSIVVKNLWKSTMYPIFEMFPRHEFIHLLDGAGFNSMDGYLPNMTDGQAKRYKEALNELFTKYKDTKIPEAERSSGLPGYAFKIEGKVPVEFPTVTAEYFFRNSGVLKNASSKLYGVYVEYFGFDPMLIKNDKQN